MQKGDQSEQKPKRSYSLQIGPEAYGAATELAGILRLSMSQAAGRTLQNVRSGPIQLQVLLTDGVVTSSAHEEYRREIAKYVDRLLEAATREPLGGRTADEITNAIVEGRAKGTRTPSRKAAHTPDSKGTKSQ